MQLNSSAGIFSIHLMIASCLPFNMGGGVSSAACASSLVFPIFKSQHSLCKDLVTEPLESLALEKSIRRTQNRTYTSP